MTTYVTYQDIADRWGKSRSTVVNNWATRHGWPGEAKTEGRTKYFDLAEIAAFVDAEFSAGAGDLSGPADELVTLREIAERVGLQVSTLTAYESRGELPEAVGRRRMDVQGPKRKVNRLVALYRLGEIRDVLAAKTPRPSRRK
ncbi:helix-turn-helix transcriptional regulator [Salininema proteolyticum]|uniref:Helix-turn-helix transcriptional regulator n=1 Tax=Salininema proteolyticum TaxID=1607685 RepID=A0ABV8TXQ8_9ACTN